jgi:hypothetical protein
MCNCHDDKNMMKKIRQAKSFRRIVYLVEEPSIRGHLVIDKERLEEARVVNREFLRTIDCWVSESDYRGSIFQYGLPSRVRHLIDLPMTDEVTYSDVISCLAHTMNGSLRYLELGVSVGKNFSQVLHQVNGVELTCFDIEDINPVLEKMLVRQNQMEWSTSQTSMRKKPSQMTEYRSLRNGNKVCYLAGDIFDEQSWERLRGQSYNLIFSDAFHSAPALLKEWEMIKACDLLAPARWFHHDVG